MDKETKRKIRVMVVGIVGVVLLLIGISFATFSSNLEGTQVQGIKAGCLKVDMTDNGNLTIDKAAPDTDENGLKSEPYTYKITNNCNVDAFFKATINVLEGSNLDNVNKIKVAIDGDSYLAPTIEGNLEETELVDDSELDVVKTFKLDEGFIASGESKTFNLRTWIDYDVEEISGSLLNKIIILSTANQGLGIAYSKNTAGYSVIEKNTVLQNPNFSLIAPSDDQESGVVRVKDGNDVTYHFRGAPNNNLTFAGLDWKIVSTNSDGSINIVLNDIIENNTYDNLNSVLSSWYENNLKSEETYIKTEQQFCAELADSNGVYFSSIKTDNYNPTNKCESGNKLSKIGLLTVDDLMFAGAVYNVSNEDFYLNLDDAFFTSSSNDDYAVYSYGVDKKIEIIQKSQSLGIRPVITLKSNNIILGFGSEESPFYISGVFGATVSNEFLDNIVPEIVYAKVDDRWSNMNVHIEIAAKDNPSGSGVAGYMIKTDSAIPLATDSGWEMSNSLKYKSAQSYDNGTYYVYVKDISGNVSEVEILEISKVDKIKPSCMISVNPNGEESRNKTLSILSSDTNIDINGYYWNELGIKEDAVSINANGVYNAIITDLAGNQGTCSAVVSTIDEDFGDEAPTINVTTPSTSYQESKSVTVSITSADPELALDAYCVTDTNNSTSCNWQSITTAAQTASELTVNQPTSLGKISNRGVTALTLSSVISSYSFVYTATQNETIYIFARDEIGNISAPKIVQFTKIGPVITSPPTVTVSTPSTAYATSKSVTLGFTSASSDVELDSYCVTTATTSTNCSWTKISGSVTTYSTTYKTSTANTYYVYAKDIIGNTSSGKSFTITNIGKPVTSISVSSTTPIWVLNGSGKTTTAKATVTPSDAAVSGVTWSSSNTSVATVSSSGVITPKTNGSVTITATAKDGSGVKGTKTVKVYKATAPTSTISTKSVGDEVMKRTMNLTSHVLSASNGSSSVTVTIGGHVIGEQSWLGTADSGSTSNCGLYSRWIYLDGAAKTKGYLVKQRSVQWGSTSTSETKNTFCAKATITASTAGTYYARVYGNSNTSSCNSCGATGTVTTAGELFLFKFSSYSLKIAH